MGPMKSSSSFIFIDQSTDATARVSGAQRKAIRKQAMRTVGLARRERGGYGKVNIRQLPIFLGSLHNLDEVHMHVDIIPEEDEAGPKQSKVSRMAKGRTDNAPWLASHMPSLQGYERLRMELGFDLMWLSPLTTVHFSRAVATSLANDPSRLQQLMVFPVLSSFLFHIPARYEQSVLLQKATRWATAQAQRLFNPHATVTQECTLALLDEVLHELSAAVADSNRQFASDTLCTSQLLAMLTMLEKKEVLDWTQFAIGAGKILRFRGPESFKTDFDCSMLVSYVGFIFIETLSRNRDCFLEAEAWKTALQAMAVTEPLGSERHELIIEMWTDVFPISRLFRETTDYILAEEHVDIVSCQQTKQTKIGQIILECRQIREKHIQWRKKYVAFTRRYQACTGGIFKAREFFAISFASQLLVDRFILALEPLAAGAQQMEDEVQEMAKTIEMMRDEAQHADDWQCDVLMTRKLVFAEAARASEAAWSRAYHGDVEALSTKGTISEALFVDWNTMIGREYRAKTCQQLRDASVL